MTKVFGIVGVPPSDLVHRVESLGYERLLSDTDVGLWLAEAHGKSKFRFAKSENGFALVIGNPVEPGSSPADEHLARSLAIDPAQAVLDRYLTEGDPAFAGLEGVYLVVVWDASTRTLKVVRDDAGAQLVYFTQTSAGAVCFSNKQVDLLKAAGKPAISEKGLWEFLRFLDISPPYTIYENLWFLDPDDILALHRNDWKTYRKPLIPSTTLDYPAAGDSPEDILESLLRESIARRIRGVERLGVFLSGGIDSSLVCAIAAELRPDLRAYTVGFEDRQFDESGIASAVAGALGVEHRVLKFGLEQDREAFLDFTATTASPFSDPAIIPTYQCFRAVSDEVDVALDGTGADTLIGIMPARHVRFILQFSRHLPAAIRQGIVRMLGVNRRLRGYTGLFDFEDERDPLIRWRGWKGPEIARLTGGAQVDLSHTLFYRLYAENSRKTPYELYSLLMGALPDDRIHQSASAFGPRVEFPFVDKAVRDYVRRLPMKFLYSKGESKKPLRRLLAKRIPREIWDVPKHGFDYPFERLLQYRNHEFLNTFLSPETLAEHGLFEPGEVNAYVTRFRQGDMSVKFKIWGLAIFQAWYLRFYRAL